ncbi:hypothetical protein QE152_g4197 [Popillia japonica]|uniref:Uncharacterized protein n=1 Tax=Popillia japonica TaxID=7064 RepID=A0AAW1N1H7_POPJA
MDKKLPPKVDLLYWYWCGSVYRKNQTGHGDTGYDTGCHRLVLNKKELQATEIVPYMLGHMQEILLEEDISSGSYIKWHTERRFPRRIDDLFKIVQHFVTKTKRYTPFHDNSPGKKWYKAFIKQHPKLKLRTSDVGYTPFHDNSPGKKWYKAFIKQHPKLKLRTSDVVTSASGCISQNDMKNWFTTIANGLDNDEEKNRIEKVEYAEEKLDEAPLPEKQLSELETKRKTFVVKGTCYKCTYNVTIKNVDRKCSKCLRQFLIKCLDKDSF